MMYLRSLLVWTAAAVGALVAIPALAAGTAAGTPIDNNVTLDYSVNGFAQSQEAASVQFVVDRAIATVVQAQGASAVAVTANQTSSGASGYPALNFDVTNTGNDTQDLWLAVSDRGNTPVTGLSGQGSGTAFAATNVIVAIDDGNGVYDDGTDTVLALSGNHYVLPSVAPDTPVRILVVVDVPLNAANDAPDTFTLIAGVAADGGPYIGGDTSGHNAPGFSVATNDADVVGSVQNLFADDATADSEDVTWDFNTDVVVTTADVQYNGQHSDSNAFVVRRAQLYVGKAVQVLWDPVNGNRYSADNSDTVAADPKAVPGAVLMYAVGVQNETGSVAATGVTVNDNLQNTGIALGNPGGASVFVPDTVEVTLNGSPVSLDVPNSPNLGEISYRTCATPGTVQTTTFGVGDPEVSASLGDCAATETGVIVYFVTVQ